jgi:glycosyltransferase involved in cell wall biosynthesis
MKQQLPEYTVAIRTLGTAGEKYQRLLNSLVLQSHQPAEIIVYIAEGYALPKETCGRERYVYVKKGMVAQRALQYDEIKTEWILFLDDDVEIPKDGVANAFRLLSEHNADVIAPDTFEHTKIPVSVKLKMAVLLSAIPRFWSKTKGYTITIFGSYCYNPYRSVRIGCSTTNAGPAFLCRKQDFLNVHFENDLWLDKSPYAIPEDQVMFYKMHLNGLKILTQYHSGWLHLDAGTATSGEKARKAAYSAARNHTIFYGLYLQPYLKIWQKPLVHIVRAYRSLVTVAIGVCKAILTRNLDEFRASRLGSKDGKQYLRKLTR